MIFTVWYAVDAVDMADIQCTDGFLYNNDFFICLAVT